MDLLAARITEFQTLITTQDLNFDCISIDGIDTSGHGPCTAGQINIVIEHKS